MTEIQQGQIWENKLVPEERVQICSTLDGKIYYKSINNGKSYESSKIGFILLHKPAEVYRINTKPTVIDGVTYPPSWTAGQKHDPVNHPKHYTSDPSGVECIEITRHRNFNIGNAFKYLWRAGLKDGNSDIDDLKKAIWYIQDEIERLEGEQ